MGIKIHDDNVFLTLAEQVLLGFLQSNKGSEFTSEEVEDCVGIPASKVDDIMDNLRWKGFEVCTEKHRGVHYYANNTWRSFLVGGAIIATMIMVMLWGFMDHFG